MREIRRITIAHFRGKLKGAGFLAKPRFYPSRGFLMVAWSARRIASNIAKLPTLLGKGD